MCIRAVGLYPNVVAIDQSRKRPGFKTQQDGKVELHPASVNGNHFHYPFRWLVYNEKVKTTGIFIRDSTMVSDYGMLLFGGQLEGQ